MYKEKDTYSYRGWLNSDSFIKRALAISGYMLVVQLFVLFFAGVLTYVTMAPFFK